MLLLGVWTVSAPGTPTSNCKMTVCGSGGVSPNNTAITSRTKNCLELTDHLSIMYSDKIRKTNYQRYIPWWNDLCCFFWCSLSFWLCRMQISASLDNDIIRKRASITRQSFQSPLVKPTETVAKTSFVDFFLRNGSWLGKAVADLIIYTKYFKFDLKRLNFFYSNWLRYNDVIKWRSAKSGSLLCFHDVHSTRLTIQ